jgi:hypothetical protein
MVVETMEQFSNNGRPLRREYSKSVKAQVVAQCGQRAASPETALAQLRRIQR